MSKTKLNKIFYNKSKNAVLSQSPTASKQALHYNLHINKTINIFKTKYIFLILYNEYKKP